MSKVPDKHEAPQYAIGKRVVANKAKASAYRAKADDLDQETISLIQQIHDAGFTIVYGHKGNRPRGGYTWYNCPSCGIEDCRGDGGKARCQCGALLFVIGEVEST